MSIMRKFRVIIMSSKSSNVHSVASSGFGEGTNDFYDQKRPSYPVDALRNIAEALPEPHDPSIGLRILEPGSGTGIFSRLMLNPPENYPKFHVGELVGIEPSKGMRRTWSTRWGDNDPRGRTVEGTFDNFSQANVEPGTVDAVIIAQAWHWCPDHEAALREVAKYLQPKGVLIMIWNLESDEVGFHAQVRESYEKYTKGTPQYYKMWWKAMYGTDAHNELFASAETKTCQWAKAMTEDQVVDRIFSRSYLQESELEPTERVKVDKAMRDAIQRGENKRWVDEKAGMFEYGYRTDVVIHKLK